MKELVYEPREAIQEFVATKCPGLSNANDFGPSVVFGWKDGDVLLAGCVLYNLRNHEGKPIEAEAAIAASSPRWCSKSVLNTIGDVVFNKLGCIRLTARVARKNKRARKLVEGVGFTLEGVKKRAYNGRQDLMIYGMLKDKCRWLNGNV